jgi:pyruvate/2-oxoglutarate dehydrogenase complex dihydrolipoamide dehydrogenase (E3) component
MTYPGEQFDALSWQLLCPQDYVNPAPKNKYHLVVVGAGPAGLISAIGAAGLGASVALVERHRMGGDCLNVGCMPSKALLSYTQENANPEFADAFSWLREVRASIAHHDSVERYSQLGVDVFLGDAKFNKQGLLQVDDVTFNTRRIALCTGARAALPPISGLDAASVLTNESIFDLDARPDSIGILGGGAIGCELAQVFSRLGVRVELFEQAPRLLPLENPMAGEVVADALAESGVNLHLGAAVKQIDSEGNILIDDGLVTVEKIMVAAGRKPNVESLNLEAAGIKLNFQGFIAVDEKLRTSNKKVFAAGDCATEQQFTHHADAQARALIQNTLFAPTAKVSGLVIPHCTYTSPEVASIGPSLKTLRDAGIDFDQYEFDFTELDRIKAKPFVNEEVAKRQAGHALVLTVKGSDRILAATIIGADAGELLAPICLMMSNGLGLAAAQRTIFSYPTRSEFLKRLGDAYNKSRMTPKIAAVFDWWLKRSL